MAPHLCSGSSQRLSWSFFSSSSPFSCFQSTGEPWHLPNIFQAWALSHPHGHQSLLHRCHSSHWSGLPIGLSPVSASQWSGMCLFTPQTGTLIKGVTHTAFCAMTSLCSQSTVWASFSGSPSPTLPGFGVPSGPLPLTLFLPLCSLTYLSLSGQAWACLSLCPGSSLCLECSFSRT